VFSVVAQGPQAHRIWPPAGIGDSHNPIFCADSLVDMPEELSIDSAPVVDPGEFEAINHSACFGAYFDNLATGTYVVPPLFGSIEVDPSVFEIASPVASGTPSACPQNTQSLATICLRTEDDRIVLYSVGADPTLVMGDVGDAPFALNLATQDYRIMRGFPAQMLLQWNAQVHSLGADSTFDLGLLTTPPKPHLVVNEVLPHPPSGVASQRFVEIINEGDFALDLSPFSLVANATPWPLPPITLPAGGMLLVIPSTFVDGLGGDVTPAPGCQRMQVDALDTRNQVQIVDASGAVVSEMPIPNTTRTVSRIRANPSTPDDAFSAFSWDLERHATPCADNTTYHAVVRF